MQGVKVTDNRNCNWGEAARHENAGHEIVHLGHKNADLIRYENARRDNAGLTNAGHENRWHETIAYWLRSYQVLIRNVVIWCSTFCNLRWGLLVLIEYFSLGTIRLRRYIRANVGSKSAISLQRGPVDPKFQVEGVAPPPTILFLRKLG